jgi:hypothetical protein
VTYEQEAIGRQAGYLQGALEMDTVKKVNNEISFI